MTKVYPFKQALITAVISAIFATCAFSVFNVLKQQLNWQITPATIRGITGLLTLVILAIGIYSGMSAVKRANAGQLSYGQALLTGIMVALTVGLTMMVLGFIYTHYINPGYFDYMVAEGKKEMVAEGKSPSEIAAGVTGLQWQFSAAGQAIQAMVAQTGAGTIISLVMAVFMRTKKQ